MEGNGYVPSDMSPRTYASAGRPNPNADMASNEATCARDNETVPDTPDGSSRKEKARASAASVVVVDKRASSSLPKSRGARAARVTIPGTITVNMSSNEPPLQPKASSTGSKSSSDGPPTHRGSGVAKAIVLQRDVASRHEATSVRACSASAHSTDAKYPIGKRQRARVVSGSLSSSSSSFVSMGWSMVCVQCSRSTSSTTQPHVEGLEDMSFNVKKLYFNLWCRIPLN